MNKTHRHFLYFLVIFVPVMLLFIMINMFAGGYFQVPVVHAATIQVTTAVDAVADDGSCSLREAITAANSDTASGIMPGECAAGSGDDVISLPPLTYTLIITGSNEENNETGDLDIVSHIILQNEGPEPAIIQAGPDADSGIDRVFHIRTGGGLIGNDLIIRYGHAQDPCGFPFACRDGGGVYTQGVFTLTNSIVMQNTADRSGGGIYIGASASVGLIDSLVAENVAVDDGGGIYQSDDLVLLRSQIVTNTTSQSGGGIYNLNSDRLVINDSFIASNEAAQEGGGLYTAAGVISRIWTSTLWNNTAATGGGLFNASAIVDIRNSTFSGNSATLTGGGIHNNSNLSNIDVLNGTIAGNSAGAGGGLYNRQSGVIRLTNTMVADSPSGGDCAVEGTATSVTNGLFNIIEDGTCIPSAASPDPLLGPLQDNGGTTMTHALLLGSPAIDKNSTCMEARPRDQRQIIRPQGAGCDIGAYEAISLEPESFFVYLPFLIK